MNTLRNRLTLLAVLFSVNLFAMDLFVSPAGKDSNPGTKDKPLATLTGARDAIRALRARRGAIQEGINVIITGGTYFMEKPLELTATDAATSENPLVFKAAPGEKVEFIGGLEISNFEKVNASLWKASIPEVARYGWLFEQLYVNGKRAVRARTPNAGQFFWVKSVEQTIMNKGSGRSAKFAVQQIKTDSLDTEHLKKEESGELKEALLTFYHKWDNTRKFVSEFDPNTYTLYTVGQGMKPWNEINEGSRYFIENLRSALDAPGEWFLEKEGTLYYKPLEGEQIENTRFFAPVLEKFVVIKGDQESGKLVEHISFRNLAFKVAGYKTPVQGNEPAQAASPIDAVIMVDYAQNIEFENCEIAHTGLGAIWFREATSDCKVRHSYLHDLGAGGIKIGPLSAGKEGAAISKNNVVDNNIIRGGGWVFPCAVGVAVFHASENKVTHNEIADFRYSGISVGWIWGYDTSFAKRNIIKYNHIHHLGWGDLSDMGGVYTLGKSEGTEISNNIIHHIYSQTYGGWGLYTDEGSTGIVMENNLVYACKSAGFHQHYGRDNFIRNNIFAFNIKNQLQATRVEEHNSFNFTNNIVYFNSGSLFGSNWDSINFESDSNIYWDERARDISFGKFSFQKWQQKGKDQHSVIANPGFTNPHAFDFSLKNRRIARKVGFKPFDFSKVGVYGSKEWRELAEFDPVLAREFDEIVAENESSK